MKNWDDKVEVSTNDEAKVEKPVKSEKQSKYVAVVGVSFDKHGIRVEAGKTVPSKCLEDPKALNWLLNVRKAIRLE